MTSLPRFPGPYRLQKAASELAQVPFLHSLNKRRCPPSPRALWGQTRPCACGSRMLGRAQQGVVMVSGCCPRVTGDTGRLRQGPLGNQMSSQWMLATSSQVFGFAHDAILEGLSWALDSMSKHSLTKSSLKLAQPLPRVALPYGGCLAGPSTCLLSWCSEATSRWESIARTCGGPNEELPGFNYAPGPGSAPFD